MTTDPAPPIKRELDQLIALQIQTLKRDSSLTSPELSDHRRRSEKLRTLCRELDRIASRNATLSTEKAF